MVQDGTRFRTICKDGTPWMEPTQFLMRYGHVGLGSARTMDTYTERLIPFCRWIAREHLSFREFDQHTIHRFRRDLVIRDTAHAPLLRKGPDSSDRTIRDTVTMASRFIEWLQNYRHIGLASQTESLQAFRLGRGQPLSVGLARAKRKLPKRLTSEQLDQCREWIMATYEFDPALQLPNRAIFELLYGGAIRLDALSASEQQTSCGQSGVFSFRMPTTIIVMAGARSNESFGPPRLVSIWSR